MTSFSLSTICCISINKSIYHCNLNGHSSQNGANLTLTCKYLHICTKMNSKLILDTLSSIELLSQSTVEIICKFHDI